MNETPLGQGPPGSGPAPALASCPGCGQGVDPLRAGHVAILEGRFRYFCRSDCKQRYLQAQGRPLEEEVSTRRPPEVATHTASLAGAFGDVRPRVASRPSVPDRTPPPSPVAFPAQPPTREAGISRPTLPSPDLGVEEPAPAPVSTPRSSARSSPQLQAPPYAPAPLDRSIPALDAAGIALGALVPALSLLGPSADVARLPLVLASFAALSGRFALARRDLADAHPLVIIVPALGAVVAACWAASAKDPHAVSIAVLAGLTCATAIAIELLVARARARVVQARDQALAALDVGARVVRGDQTLVVPAAEVRPGEQVIIEAGETVGVDAIVIAGEARVVPWLDAHTEVVKREGDPVVAGARVVSSRLRVTTTWSGRERAWAKLLSASGSRIDVGSPTPRLLRVTVERGAPVAGALLGLAAFGANSTPVQILGAMCAGAVAFGARGVASFVALHFTRAHLEALASGITYKDPRAFERAAAAHVAVLSARGTVLLGEPEIVAIEPIGSFAMERVLALAAGAEAVSAHPFAAAILRAARTRGMVADPVRNATARAGLGVTASASSGERLVVGGRAIMLEEKVGVAVVDARISELEALGRSVLLVALGDRLVGLIALMDGLRPGARAAVQKLLDVHIEPALLSGEARETCETLARALDIEHVRPEVLPADRGPEVRALAEGGSVVAVVGHPLRDDGALGAADVAVAMTAAGSTPGEWAVALASDDVRDAASALTIPHLARERARMAIVLGVAPGLVALLAIGFGIASPAIAPLGLLIGALAVAVQAREAPSPV
jgi:P-type Cu+ transporter